MYLTEDQEKEIVTLEKALIKDGRQDWIKEMRVAEKDQLEFKLLNLAKHAQEITNTKNRDEELLKAKKHKSSLEAPYREQTKYNKKLSRFVSLLLIEEEGDVIIGDDDL